MTQRKERRKGKSSFDLSMKAAKPKHKRSLRQNKMNFVLFSVLNSVYDEIEFHKKYLHKKSTIFLRNFFGEKLFLDRRLTISKKEGLNSSAIRRKLEKVSNFIDTGKGRERVKQRPR
jgi:hypothetical protein